MLNGFEMLLLSDKWITNSLFCRVIDGDYSFIMEKPLAEYLVSKHACDLKTIKSFNVGEGPASYAFAMAKKHDLYDEVNGAVMAVSEEGLLSELYQKWWKREACTSGSSRGTGNGSGIARVSLLLVIAYFMYNIL